MILNPQGPLSFSTLYTGKEPKGTSENSNSDTSFNTTDLDDIVARHIEKILSLTRGQIHGEGGAAKLLGINASTLRNRMNKLGIQYKKSDIYN